MALDHVCWDIIDAKRASLRLPKVGDMGRHRFTDESRTRMVLAGLGAAAPLDAATLAMASDNVRGAGVSEVFDRRQPEHVYLAGTVGLGVYDLNLIRHTKAELV